MIQFQEHRYVQGHMREFKGKNNELGHKMRLFVIIIYIFICEASALQLNNILFHLK